MATTTTEVTKEEVESDTVEIDKLLARMLNHPFSVWTDDTTSNEKHSTKRQCQLSGPFLLIVDPTQTVPTLNLYLPQWECSVKKSKNHRSIVLQSNEFENIHTIKLKSKNQKAIDLWAKWINNGVEDIKGLKLRIAEFKCKLNMEGSFLKSRLYITNDGISISRQGKTVVELPRAPVTKALPNLNEALKIHLYKNGVSSNTITCEKIEDSRRLILAVNSEPDDLKTIPDFFIGETNIPDIPDEIFESIEANDGAKHNDVVIEAEVEEEDDDFLGLPQFEEEEEGAPQTAEKEEESEKEDEEQKKQVKKKKKVIKTKSRKAKDKPKKRVKKKSGKNVNDDEEAPAPKKEKETPQFISKENNEMEKKKNALLGKGKDNAPKPKKSVVIETSDFIPADKNPWPESEKEQSKSKKASQTSEVSKKQVSESRLYNDPVNFQRRMNDKLEKLAQLPRNEKPPDITTLISQNCAQFGLKEKPGSYPFLDIPDIEEEIIPFQVPNNAFSSILYSNALVVPTVGETKTLQSTYDIEEIVKSFPPNFQAALKRSGYTPPKEIFDIYTETMKQFKELPPPQQPVAACGLFLQGRSSKLKQISKQLAVLKYPIGLINESLKMMSFSEETDFENFFIGLYKHGFINFFFETVKNEQDFIINNYFPDAFMRCDSFCNDICALSCKPFDQVEPKLGPLPYQGINAPHIIFSNRIPRFMNSITQELIPTTEFAGKRPPSDLSYIIASLIQLMAIIVKNNHLLVRSKEYAFLWSKINGLSRKFNKPNFFKFNERPPKEVKIVSFLINVLFDRSLTEFLLLFLQNERANQMVQELFVLSMNELVKLEAIKKTEVESQEIVIRTKEDVDHIFAIQ
ncbi:hypothetical protein GPJ56_000140 [Histomonas meleagridis]|uniref:uncharacterized protein n=1 Tax=Histomonas meleagridis TaxID=135588 RepID=UPI003559CC94|nr:hypothetical protein GPJ56_000140 [Histomonas meleagridis]KAH0805639.1 hypothetical protein GO595_001694 [Histomonas meleagridis]